MVRVRLRASSTTSIRAPARRAVAFYNTWCCDFDNAMSKLDEAGVLFEVVARFGGPKVDLHPRRGRQRRDGHHLGKSSSGS